MLNPKFISLFVFFSGFAAFAGAQSDLNKIRVLIVDGSNNHDWRTTTDSLRATLNAAGIFKVDVSTAPQSKMYPMAREPKEESAKDAYRNFVDEYGKAIETTQRQPLTEFDEALEVDPPTLAVSRGRYLRKYSNHVPHRREFEKDLGEQWNAWNPDFTEYDTVLLNYNGRSWPSEMQKAFAAYVRDGGGVVLIHATNNSFRDWDAFNEIIGLGWNGNRGTKDGACTKFNPETGSTYTCCVGKNSGHGSKHPFVLQVREPNHPVMQGIPLAWRHGRDELYHNLRGPAKNMTVLSTAYSDPQQGGSGDHEPITLAINYGKGRVIHTTMGHFWPGQTYFDSLHCVGFQTLIARSCQYTAIGKVTLDVPAEFPKDGDVSIIPPHLLNWTIDGIPTRTTSEDQTEWKQKIESNPYSILTPQEQLESFEIADGYVAELVASEPDVQEPVLAVWDADGAMYVAEMRSYMQDEVGTGTKTLNNGRVKKLVDTDGDGQMDQVTIFVDNLNLPRMILPLDERIAIVETDNTRVVAYTDTDGDGVADKKETLFEGRESKDRKKSVEHQDSGLIWNIDNWIYVSYNRERYRFTDGKWKAESTKNHWSQWGLGRDDVGNIFYSSNDRPVVAQIPQVYWGHVKRLIGRDPRFVPSVGFPFEPEFLTAKNLCTVGDKGPGSSSTKKFTSLCGQEIYRGDAFPHDVYGNLFFVDPTIHVVRRAAVDRVNGKVVLSNPHGSDEFLISPDFNFRPVNTHSAPDGCLYVVDMYRGIIQDAGWYNENNQAYAREKGFNNHVQRGRIWRIRHKNHQPRTPPRMLDASPLELIRHLDSPNGWLRDTAQKLIVLRAGSDQISDDERKEAIAVLMAAVRFNPHRPLLKLHALWTLDGLGEASQSLVEFALTDRDRRVQSAAVQIGERFIREENKAFYDSLEQVAEKCDGDVAKQLILSLGYSNSERADSLIEKAALKHIVDDGVFLAVMASSWGKDNSLIQAVRDGTAFAKVRDQETRNVLISRWNEGLAAWDYKRPPMPKDWTTRQKWLAGGEGIFFDLCARCHGPNGEGQKLPGHTLLLAPPLAGSPRVKGDPQVMIRILLHGLTGPVNGQTYGHGVMPKIEALGQGDPNRITQVANFVRYAWGNGQEPIEVDVVKDIIKETAERKNAYTLKELGVDSGGFVNDELEKELMGADVDSLAKLATDEGDAKRGKEVFYSATVACFSCHDPPPGGVRMGPDLAKLESKTSRNELVDAVLRPSKTINKDFRQVKVLTAAGKVHSGLQISENESELVLRNTSDGKRIVIPQDDIEQIMPSRVSIMPSGLVTQFKDKQQFLDLIAFLVQLRD